MKKYNVGIIGYGWVATAHIPAINASPLAQVTAIVVLAAGFWFSGRSSAAAASQASPAK